MYQQYFHFNELPFSIAPDPHFIFMSERHQEGLAHLLYGINMGGGFVALTGEVGTGKTTLCRCLLEQLPANVDIALILNPKLNAIELLITICDELGIAYDKHQQTLKKYIDSINQYLLAAYAKGRRTVLLIDEAQNLSMEVLEQIRLLTNLETSKTKLLQIILVGQPELQQILNREDLRQLNQRITARYHLLPLSLAETRAYVRHRLTVCSGEPDLFSERAIRKIYQVSSGVPRIINVLCDRALLGAYATNTRAVSPKIVGRAAQEALGLGYQRSRAHGVLALTLLVGIGAGLYTLYRYPGLLDQGALMTAGLSIEPDAIGGNPRPMPVAETRPEPVPTQPEAKSLSIWLADPALSMDRAMLEALKIWNKPAPEQIPVDCKYLATLGLHCLFDKANWRELLELDRPAILEFALPSGEKRYGLLTGIRNGQPLIRFGEEVPFPLFDLLNFWDGYYLMLWKPSRPGMLGVAPQQLSTNVVWLRQQLSAATGDAVTASQPLFFDESLKAQVIKFQRQHHLAADGIAGARTLIHLDNATGAGDSPHLKTQD